MKLLVPLLVIAIVVTILSFPNATARMEKIKGRFAQLEPRLAQACCVNGKWKKQLPPEWQQELSALCAHWSYSGQEDHYAVSFGDYQKDGFYLSWDSKDREWISDM